MCRICSALHAREGTETLYHTSMCVRVRACAVSGGIGFLNVRHLGSPGRRCDCKNYVTVFVSKRKWIILREHTENPRRTPCHAMKVQCTGAFCACAAEVQPGAAAAAAAAPRKCAFSGSTKLAHGTGVCSVRFIWSTRTHTPAHASRSVMSSSHIACVCACACVRTRVTDDVSGAGGKWIDARVRRNDESIDAAGLCQVDRFVQKSNFHEHWQHKQQQPCAAIGFGCFMHRS